MSVYRIQVIGDKALVRDLNRISKEIGASVDDVLDTSARSIENTMKGNAPDFTGELKRSIKIFKKSPNSRWIGPTTGKSSEFPPSHYGYYVNRGGGPTSKLPNVHDIALRMGIGPREAFAFAKYLRDTGKAVQRGSKFVQKTRNSEARVFQRTVKRYLDRIVR